MARLVKRPRLDEILAFCAEDPIERVFLEDVARRGLGTFAALRDGGRLGALCHLGTNIVPSGEGTAGFARVAHQTRPRMLVGDQDAVTALWDAARDGLPDVLDDRPGQPVYVLDRPPPPGDTLRARYIAETFLDEAIETNAERGMLGYTGTFEGRRVSVQATGMGCPSAAIVVEELVQLGVTRLLRVGTCGGLQADLALGDLIVAISAVSADSTAAHLLDGEPHAPTADWELVHAAVHAAKELGRRVRVGPIVSSDLFYNPDEGQYGRWSDRGILAVEMEAAVLFTLGALRRVKTGCLLTVSDVVVEGEFVRISDDEMRAAVDAMTELGLQTVTADRGS